MMPQNWWSRLGQSSLDLLFPPRCCHCEKPGDWLCADCIATITPINGLLCERCGDRVLSAGLCYRCRAQPPDFDELRSAFVYEGAIRSAIHALKYEGKRSYAALLAAMAASGLPQPDRYEFVTAVPMTAEALQQRGFNHAEKLAVELSHRFQLPLLPTDGLLRRFQTRHQVGQDFLARQDNVRNAFEAQGSLVRNHRILVIDDVCTTAATLRACATALRQAGASKVGGYTIARALSHT